tara:strand:- start:60 stop:662 length:603 start_codon:yes stop_codon:yes gene_type:complete
MRYLIFIIYLSIFISFQTKANDVTDWLKSEIDYILEAYKNENLSESEKFDYIEDTINKNFAGAGIGKFVAGKAWSSADKETKKQYINLFKRHLALNIASMMQGYSDQTYSLINTKIDNANKVFLIDMEVQDKTNKLIITWRVKESKNRFYVIDLLVADISLVVTKRSEFNSMLKKADYSLESFNETLDNQNKLSYSKLIQ